MKTHPRIALGLVVTGLSLGVFACSQDEPARTPSNPDPSTAAIPSAASPNDPAAAAALAASSPAPAAAAPAAPMLSNEQILEVTRTANEGEIAQARLAQSRTRSERVQKLAAMMLHDHQTAEKKGDALAVKDSLTLQSSPTSESLQIDTDGFTRALKAESGPGFDRQYVETQIREHEAVLDTIDRKLMPSASNADVKAYLEDIRVSVASHLEHARQVEQELNRQAQN